MAQQIKNLVSQLVNQDSNWKLSLLKNWNSIVGELSKKMAIVKIGQNNLTLGVYDSCWLQELYLLSPTILHLINQTLDRPRLKQLFFKRIGTRKKIALKRHNKHKEIAQTPYILTKKEHVTLQNIKDSELRKQLKNFLIRCHREGANEEDLSSHDYDTYRNPANRQPKRP